MTNPTLTARGRLLFTAIIVILFAALAEAFSFVVIKIISPRLGQPILRTSAIFHDQSVRIQRMLDHSDSLFMVFDAALGWRFRPGYRSDLYTIGMNGLRGTREYTTLPAPGVLRADAFGDSFVFGGEVNDSVAWPAIVEREFSKIEVPNYGVGAYGSDQTFLSVVASGRELHPQVVIVGWVPDDLRRNVNVYRRFLSTDEQPLVKPRFVLSPTGALTLVPTPLSGAEPFRQFLERPRDVVTMGRQDSWYTPLIYRDPLYDYSATVRLATTGWLWASRRYWGSNRLYVGGVINPHAGAFRLQVALFDRPADSIRQQGSEPLFVLFPDREQLGRVLRGTPLAYQPLLDTLRAHGLNPLDASQAFVGAAGSDVDRFFMVAHYSPTANHLVARWIGRILEEKRSALRAQRGR